MKRKTNKALSILLALCMAVSLLAGMGVTASAAGSITLINKTLEDGTPEDGTIFVEGSEEPMQLFTAASLDNGVSFAEKYVDIKVGAGDDPTDTITRAETATVVLRLLQKAGLVDVRSKV